MKILGSSIRYIVIVFIVGLMTATAFSTSVAAQEPGQRPGRGPMRDPEPEASNVVTLPPVTQRNAPRPEPAQKAILALFDKYEVVGMSVDHGEKDLDDLILNLVRNPEFPDKVNDIAVECGNSLYQPILDRYIAGEDVPLAEVRRGWSDTTNPQCGLVTFYEEFFPLVRQINKNLPPEKKLRVLAGDPPIDWSKVKNQEDLMRQPQARDESVASVMEKEVLSKHRKALMLFGTFHLYHGNSAVGRYEKDYPKVTYVIQTYSGFGMSEKNCDEIEKRLASWPVPSLATIKGTWLDVDSSYFVPTPMRMSIHSGPDGQFPPEQQPERPKLSKMADGFLYLGPVDLLLYEHMAANILMDKDFMAELQRKRAIMGFDGSSIDHFMGIEKADLTLLENAFAVLRSLARSGGGPGGGPGGPQQHQAGPGEVPPPSSGQPSQPPLQMQGGPPPSQN